MDYRNVQTFFGLLLLLWMGGCRAGGSESDACDGTHSVALRAWPDGDVDARTSIRFVPQPDAIIVRFECVDDHLATPAAGRDSDLYKGDVVELFIDTDGTGRTLIEIQVNPNNDVLDLRLQYDASRQLTRTGRLTEASVQAHFRSDRRFDLDQLQTVAARTSHGYRVEVRIPFESLYRAAGSASPDVGTMRWNVVRLDRHADGSVRQTSLVEVDPGCPHISPERTRPILATAPRRRT